MTLGANSFEQATLHHRAGRLNDAERDYLEILKIDQSNTDVLRLLAALYVQMELPERAIALFERAHRLQPKNAEILNNLGVALRNVGRLNEAIQRYEQAVSANPDYTQARGNLGNSYYDRGNELIATGQGDRAAEWFERAVRLDPQNFRALNNLANLNRAQGRFEEAVTLCKQALRLNPFYTEAHINLGNVFRDIGKLKEARGCYEEALKLNPKSSDALNNFGTLLQDLNCHQEAIEKYDQALVQTPASDVIKSNKAFALLALGKFKEGWALNESGLRLKEKRGLPPFSAAPWDGRIFKGQRLLVWSEQGLGDNLQFVRYASLAKERGGDVWIQAPTALVRLFQSVPGVESVLSTAKESDFDHHVMMMSLPHVFATTLDTIPATIPYLRVDKAIHEKWAAKFINSVGYKVGLVWAGRSREGQVDAQVIDKRRSLDFSLLAPLFDIQGIEFYNLQKGEAALRQVTKRALPKSFSNWMAEAEDFLDTAALVQQLDLVISVDTSVAHLAGALGKPVWILSRFDGCWRWLQNREMSPWYPTARIFAQSTAGDWGPVIDRLCHQLSIEVGLRAKN